MRRSLLSILMGTVLLTAGFALSTQYVASKLRYHGALGKPVLLFQGLRLYAPWSWLTWDSRFGRIAPGPFTAAAGITSASALAFMALLLLARRGHKLALTAYGTARWAETRELRAAGLFRDRGVVLCQESEARFACAPDAAGDVRWKLKRAAPLVCHDGPEHIIIFAPPRSGKGVGLVIPTLLSWRPSVLVYDVKRELWDATAGWRRQFSHAWRFEPTAEHSVRFNPLQEIRLGLFEVRDAQNVADILVDPSGEHEQKNHWQTTAASLLVGAMLHVLYAEKDKSLAGVARFLSDPSLTAHQMLDRMLGTSHLAEGPHPVVAGAAREAKNKSDRELSGVLSTAMAALSIYRDPIIAANTSTSDFRLSDLVNLDQPASLYLVVPPSDLDRTRPLVRLLLNQITRRLTEHMSGGKMPHRHRLLALLDEFPTLGRLEVIERALATFAGYGIKCCLVAQSLNQIERAYGPNNSILDSCHIRVTFGSLDERTARRISELLGQSTQVRTHRTYSGQGLRWFRNVSESDQEYGRPLLTTGEVLQMPGDQTLLMVGNAPPYRGKKVMFYQDRRFRDLAGLPPPNSPGEQSAELPRPEGQGRLPALGPAPWSAVQRPRLVGEQISHAKLLTTGEERDAAIPHARILAETPVSAPSEGSATGAIELPPMESPCLALSVTREDQASGSGAPPGVPSPRALPL